jgi:hypothetical protein
MSFLQQFNTIYMLAEKAHVIMHPFEGGELIMEACIGYAFVLNCCSSQKSVRSKISALVVENRSSCLLGS